MNEEPQYAYLVHGTRLTSNVELPFLPLALEESVCHSEVDLRQSPPLTEDELAQYRSWKPTEHHSTLKDIHLEYLQGPNGFLLRFRPVADYVIAEDGKSVGLHVDEEELSLPTRDLLFGPVFTTALVLQGVFPLHGSCVTRDGGAVGFIAQNRQGKSTLTATFVEKGWQLLSDGLFVAYERDGRAWAHTGDSRIRLREDAAAHLGHDGTPTEDARGLHSKFRYAADQSTESSAHLKTLYILKPDHDGKDIEFKSCTGMDAVWAVISNTYAVKSYPEEALGLHLKHVGTLLGCVNLKHLVYPFGLDRLPSIYDAIINDLEAG